MTNQPLPVDPPLVYLLHFTQPYRHCRHYLGMTTLPLDERLTRHRDERGAKLLQAVLRAGGDFVVARVWACKDKASAVHLERTLKRQKHTPRLCPICQQQEK